jgi:hypothetical protein
MTRRVKRLEAGEPTGLTVPGRMRTAPLTGQELAEMTAAAGVSLASYSDELSNIVRFGVGTIIAKDRLPKGRRVARELARIGSQAGDFVKSLEDLIRGRDDGRSVASTDPRSAAIGLLLSDAKGVNGGSAVYGAIIAMLALAREAARIGQQLDAEAATYRAGSRIDRGALTALTNLLAKAGAKLTLPGNENYVDDLYPLIDTAALMVKAIERRTEQKLAVSRDKLWRELKKIRPATRAKPT